MTDWQPMETAPLKRFIRILGRVDGAEYAVERGRDEWMLYPEGTRCEPDAWAPLPPMTAEEAVRLLKVIATSDHTEEAHRDADGVLCDLLRSLGHDAVVDAYDEIYKWYS